MLRKLILSYHNRLYGFHNTNDTMQLPLEAHAACSKERILAACVIHFACDELL
jgi:hypothetical protein